VFRFVSGKVSAERETFDQRQAMQTHSTTSSLQAVRKLANVNFNEFSAYVRLVVIAVVEIHEAAAASMGI